MIRGQQSTLPPQLSYHRYDNWLSGHHRLRIVLFIRPNEVGTFRV